MLKWLWPVQEPITLYELHYWEDGSDNKVRQIWTYPFFLFVFFFCLSVIGLHTGGYSSVWFRAMTENQRRSKLTFLHRGPGANAWESFREDESCRLFAFFLNKKKKKKAKQKQDVLINSHWQRIRRFKSWQKLARHVEETWVKSAHVESRCLLNALIVPCSGKNVAVDYRGVTIYQYGGVPGWKLNLRYVFQNSDSTSMQIRTPPLLK